MGLEGYGDRGELSSFGVLWGDGFTLGVGVYGVSALTLSKGVLAILRVLSNSSSTLL
jgi:hypothetical protein